MLSHFYAIAFIKKSQHSYGTSGAVHLNCLLILKLTSEYIFIVPM